MEGRYKILKSGKIIESKISSRYAGWRPGKIFGRLDCKSGIENEQKESSFFLNLAGRYKPGLSSL